MFYLAYSQSYKSVWPVFGAANQLLAALTLISLTVWLYVRGLKSWFTIVPAIFMTITTVVSLVYKLFQEYIALRMWTVAAVDVVLLMLSVALIVLVAGKARQLVAARRKVVAKMVSELA